jgi:hypothetical protein
MTHFMTDDGHWIKNLTGQQFNSWTVLSYSHTTEHNKAYWTCCCSCKTKKAIEAFTLRSGRSRMCRKCSAKTVAEEHHASHRQSGSKLYKTWSAIKQRCYNPKQVKGYKYHGALGITMCAEWRDSFEAFAAYVGEPPSQKHSIDRWPNTKGNYEPGNVRWATAKEQVINRRPVSEWNF